MVSFSCEGCGDVLTKKKLDPHRNQCWGASFTCIDCMTHFQGTSYRAHTSCISEAQKYQGKLYKEKKPKGQQQGNQSQQQSNNSQALVAHKASVEDAPDAENGAVAIVDAPPRAPTPPAAVNVFDFLVTDETPNASKVSLAPVDDSRMIEDGQEYSQNMPGAFNGADDRDFQDNGYAYGSNPVKPSMERYDTWTAEPGKEEPYTPAPKHERSKDKDQSTGKKSDKKRKRQTLDELDLSAVKAQQEQDATMTDAPPILHTGLTGGLNKMLTHPDYPPSPDYSGDAGDNSPSSPIKRKKHSKAEKERGRERESTVRKVSDSTEQNRKSKREKDSERERRRPRELVRIRRRRTSSSSPDRERRKSKSMKAIEYHPESKTNGEGNALVLHNQSRADLFLSYINKGPDSERGLSLNKALKRYHRDRHERWDHGLSRQEEEKELWKSIRLKRNDRGEIVLFAES
ncbi:Zinc finger C2H2 LYAR-type protein [Macrophomina phaseolina MS6]|uniref:Zinc finger C2H2 LYAR-type protein n=1 Tax=Macrophomina phaseolina (strain MS6) TaxID=1126212 RepID=K2RPB6_MACPH|nr:Zinc finger C2H2 LYAR-type protein [Macrophomina phaseolina MS6]